MNHRKTYIVTGAGHFPGIGSEIALTLAKDHCVVVNSRSFDNQWQQLADLNPEQILLCSGDVTNAVDQRRLIDTALSHGNRIDGIIHNASPSGTAIYNDGMLSRESWQANLYTNLIAVYELSVMARPYLLTSGGSVINIGSRCGMQPGIGNNLAYSIAKAGMHHLTKELALMLAPVRVNAVSPGLVDSHRLRTILKDRLPDRIQQWKESSLNGQEISSSDIAESVIYLLQAKNISGQILSVCGGTSIQPPFITVKPKI